MDPRLPMRAKFGVLEQTYGLRLCAKFRPDRFILSPSVWLSLSAFPHYIDVTAAFSDQW